MLKTFVAASLSLLLMPALASAQDRWSFYFENGPAFPASIDVRVPGDTGTQFSMTDELRASPVYAWRAQLTYRLARKHVVSALAAPLTIDSSGTLDAPLAFNTAVFPAGVPLDAAYQFNSYRVTYRYEFVQREKWLFGLGFTGKIRDAYTRVEGGGVSSTKTNVGFVPLVNFKLRRVFSDRLAFVFEGDALAAPQGRAEDILAALEVRLNRRASLQFGYRLLEGGADVTEVYTFALVNYAVVGFTARF